MSAVLPEENHSAAASDVIIAAALSPAVDVVVAAAPAAPTSPYVGLVPFAESDADYFFGRDRDIEVVATNLRASRLTIFYGASGVGKSSLLRAGVLPHVQRLTELSKLSDEPPDFLLVMHREWANDPLDGLRLCLEKTVRKAVQDKTLTHLFVKDKSKTAAVERDVTKTARANDNNRNMNLLLKKIADESDVTETARANDKERNMSLLLKSWTELTGTKLLVIFDQFEDFFLHPEYCGGSGSFGEEFPKAVNNHQLPVNFMLSLRDDGLSKLDFFKGKIHDPMNNTLRLCHLDRKAAEEAIRRPLEEYNDKMKTDFSIEEESVKQNPDDPKDVAKDAVKGLVHQILDDVQVGKVKFESQGQAHVKQVVTSDAATTGSNAYQLEAPYLQLVMMRLWKDDSTQKQRRLTSETLNKKLGGVQKIVETHLEEVMSRFNAADQELTAEFIHFTVTRSGAKVSSNADDLADWADLPTRKEDIKRILHQLSEGKTHVLKSVQNLGDKNSKYYEVSHDALTPAILSWRTRYVLNREKDYVWKIKQFVRKNPRLGKSIIAFVIVLACLVIFLSLELRKKVNRIRVAEQIAEQATQALLRESEAAVTATQISSVTTDISVTLAGMVGGSPKDKEEGLKRLAELFEEENAETLPAELITAVEKLLETIQENKSNTKDYDAVRAALTNTRRAAIPTPSAQVQTLSQTNADQLPSRVYIHIPDERQRSSARESATLLRSNKFDVPGIELVNNLRLKGTQVRYFRKIDGGLASQVVQLLQSQGVGNVRVLYVPGYEDSTAMRPKHLEVWFAADAFAIADNPTSAK